MAASNRVEWPESATGDVPGLLFDAPPQAATRAAVPIESMASLVLNALILVSSKN
jgi:hypothetical protein